jgi:hypothetical protein
MMMAEPSCSVNVQLDENWSDTKVQHDVGVKEIILSGKKDTAMMCRSQQQDYSQTKWQ